ncbi:MAG: GNAT family N-acetyltransferase [Bacteroidetes bacterium]|nr:GNAT family N-acetyltransferase [Bacteroidota bacterium]
MQIEIYRATINDATLLSEFGSKTFFDTFGNTCTKEDMRGVLETYFNLEQVSKEMQDPDDYFFIAKIDGIVAGYCRLKEDKDMPLENLKSLKSIELKRLYVLDEFHGVGVAKSLMDYSIDFFKNINYQAMYLSVWEYNFRARGFYEKHGFINSGVRYDFPLGSTMQYDYWCWREL